jgi:hypothetical protein
LQSSSNFIIIKGNIVYCLLWRNKMPQDDVVYPPLWANASNTPYAGAPLVVANNATYPSGFTQSIKLPGLTTPSGNYYAAAGTALHPANVTAHTTPQKWPWW